MSVPGRLLLRRWHWSHAGLVLATVVVGSCAPPRSGAVLTPRIDEASRVTSAPRMQPVTPTRFAGELAAIGLDPRRLPKFEELSRWRRMRVMSTFTRSLGFRCTDCHDSGDHRAPTRAILVTRRMWNEFTRPFVLQGGGAVYCDSCHHGVGAMLDRADPLVVMRYMEENVAGKLELHDGEPVTCATCHGSPFKRDILETDR